MRNKRDLYKNEQTQLSNRIIDILALDANGQIILYDLDHDPQKTDQIMSLIPDLRKYFTFKNIVGLENPQTLKRPWLSIIRQITKLTHQMSSKDKCLTIDGIQHIRSKIYTFTSK